MKASKLFYKRVISRAIKTVTIASVGVWFLLTGALQAQDYARGFGWPKLEEKIDVLVNQVMKKYHLVGMTVAVSKNGRLLLSKGYGYAKANIGPNGTLEFAPMLQDSRTRIGSVTKAILTGPSGYMLFTDKGLDPKTTFLYGPQGIFGNQFQADQEIGNKRFFPIVAMAIAPDNKVYTWYKYATYSVGTSTNLGKYQKGLSYILPAGYMPDDIRGIAIAKNKNVYTWYTDGTHSVGTADHLYRYKKPDKNKRTKLPTGKTMWDVAAIAIAKSNAHVYVWYIDGTRSVGTTTNFVAYESPQPYATPHKKPGKMSPLDIRGIGIAKKDMVYVWFSNSKGNRGSSHSLNNPSTIFSYEPAEYPFPAVTVKFTDQKSWWNNITILNILTHTSGFVRNGDELGTMRMFNINNKSDLTYALIHKHFLRTRPLLFKPGDPENTSRSYSNHGFGLWTLIVPTVTHGESYEHYVIRRLLKPLHLEVKIRPMNAQPDLMDSDNYNIDHGKPVRVNFKNAGLGLAAGGWTASAKSLLWVTRFLTQNYAVETLKNMGWASGNGGKNNNYINLRHNGLINGGMAYVVIFPKGYISSSGKDLSNVHVAIASNTSDFNKNKNNKREALASLITLANNIALAVPESNIPHSWNLWGGLSEYVRHGIPEEMFPFVLEHGYRPVWLDAYSVKGKTYFNVIMRPENNIHWEVLYNLTASQFQAKFNYWTSRGYRLTHVESYPQNNTVRYAAIFEKRPGPAWQAYHGASPATHQKRFNTLVSQGYHPVNISAVSANGKVRITALYEKNPVGSFVARLGIPVNEYQARFDENAKAGRYLVYLNAYQHKGKTYFSAIWQEKPPANSIARHGMVNTQFQTTRQQMTTKGYYTRLVVGYTQNNVPRFAASWIKKRPSTKRKLKRLSN